MAKLTNDLRKSLASTLLQSRQERAILREQVNTARKRLRKTGQDERRSNF